MNAIVKTASGIGRLVNSLQQRIGNSTTDVFAQDALPFLDPVDQITEARPPRFMRSTLYVIVAMLMTTILVASIVKIDLVVIGRGIVSTEKPPMVLPPYERSILRDMRVNPGDRVTKGQVLATLDPTFAQADMSNLTGRQRGMDAQIERIEAELADRPFAPGANATAEEQLQATLFHENMNQFKSRLSALDEEIDGLAASLRTTEDDRASLTKQLEVVKEVEGMRGQLLQSQNGSKLNYLEAQNLRMRAERDVQDAGNRLKELQHSLQSKKAERQAFIDAWRRELTESLVAARTESQQITQGINKATLVNNMVALTAPADGVVMDVANKSVGSIIGNTEPLVVIVPDATLVANITINSGDIGYVHEGQEVVVKVDAFPYQRHGYLKGTLGYVVEDSAPGSLGDTSVGASSGGAVHKGRVQLQNVDLKNLPTGAKLIPGMTLSAEIKVGSRRAITFFLYPLMRGLGESLREP